MVNRVLRAVFPLVIVLLLLPASLQARAVHYFNCNDCHRSGSSIFKLDGLCLNCHRFPAAPITLNDNTSATPSGEFLKEDASNAMGTHPNYNATNAKETSHLWAVGESNPAAGAQSPTLYAYLFNGRYGISQGKVICNRCHNPHGVYTYDKKILKLDNSRDQMCRDCHLPWATSDPNAYETHPMVDDYNSVVVLPANAGKFQTLYNSSTGAMAANVGNGDVRLIYNSLSGKYMVSCTSCHGVHFTDSDSGTPDGPLNRDGLHKGDGKLLRSDGPERTDADPLIQAQLRSNLCQACHTYKVHGKTNLLGCLDCHSGHSYDPTSPNYYVLRKNANQVYVPKLGAVYNATGLNYNSADVGGNPNSDWLNGGGTGYCQGCHIIPEIPAGSGQHNGFSLAASATAADCGSCHQHSNSSGAFLGSCNTCHGYPPQDASQGGPTGYAYDSGTGSDYFTSGVYKVETNTPHKAHAGGGGDYAFACGECHGAAANSASHAGHDTGTFQEVPFDTMASGGGNMSPAYSGGATGTCSGVYCHSNGGARTGASRNYVAATIPDWKDGSTTGAITTCDACHGNTAGTMLGVNSDRHQQHVGRYSCNVCHKDTAASSTALAAGAIGGKHVNGVQDVVYNTAYNLGAGQLTYNSALYATGYDAGTGRCSVYCHSNGNGAMANIPDWDYAPVAPPNCTVCHNGDVASGTPMSSGSHGAHVNDTDNEIGWNLGCIECHANTVSDNYTIYNSINHINGIWTLGIDRGAKKTSCSNISCHSDGNFDNGTPTYKDPTWGVELAGCDDCHGGSGNAYPSYADGNPGTGLSNSHNTHVGVQGYACETCHSGTATGSALKTGGTALHVNQSVDVSGSKFTWNAGGESCNTNICHGDTSPAWGTQIVADTCTKCHGEQVASPTDAQKAPGGAGVDTNGDSVPTDAQVGAHQAHLTSASNYGADIACTDCHLVPTAVGDAGHIDDVVYNAAELTWSSLANNSGGLSPAYNATTGDCSNTYCHGAQMPKGSSSGNDTVPTWNQTTYLTGNYDNDCNQCHGFPPTDNSNHIGMTVGDGSGCSTCHPHVNDGVDASESGWAGGVFNDPSKHIDGTVEASGCNGCHGVDGGQYWPDGTQTPSTYADDQAGAHEVHVLTIAQKIWGLNKAGLLADSTKQKTVCSFCHPNPGGNNHNNDTGNAQRVDVYQDTGAGDYFRKWAPGGGSADDNNASANQAYNYNSASCSNLACHNLKITPTGANDWNSPPSTPDCSVCHTANGSGVGRHDTHIGKGYTCDDCHVNNGTFPGGNTNLDHADGVVDLLFNSVGTFERSYGDNTLTYGDPTPYFGDGDFWTCSSAACHADTQTPAFNAAPATPNNCNICHSNTPATAAHMTHLSGAYGPNLGTDCGGCHDANHNNTDMTGYATHVNGSVTFNSATLLAATTACDACHGGATPAGTAKTNWPTAARVSCESCHGDYADAVVGGKTAPHTAGTGAGEYTAGGHGKAGVAQGCAACHNQNAAGHMDGVSGDDARLAVVAGYNSATDSVGFCASACHAKTMTLHYTNGLARNPTYGDSFPNDGAMNCQTCHNQHGQNLDADGLALDTMIRPVIDGKNIVALYNTAVRTDYYIDPPNSGADTGQWGICQACHDPTDASAGGGAIDNFNRTTANSGHYSGVCTSCHKHDDATVAFKPSGCSGCHGDAGAGNFWPDTASTSTVNYPDRVGLHVVHVDAIGDQINGGGPGSATLDDKNASCVYCHPDPGGNNVNGAGHDVDTLTSPASVADLHKDGYNPATSYLNMQAGSDPEGLYTPAIKRCSAVDCHSSGEFTWTWYPDVLAPGTVGDLAAVTGSEPGTVDLTWTAPANDGASGPNSYHNEVRYSTSAITSGSLYNSATVAGGPPSVLRRGNTQTMTVAGLTPGATSHFAVKVADEEYNWSTVSNSASASAKADDQPPVFFGLATATPSDEPGVVELAWEPAQDHSLPVTYSIWYNVATIDYNSAALETEGTSYRVTGLPTGILYNFAVRAKDAVTPTPNADTNTKVLQQLAKTPPKLASTSVEYFTSGTTALQTGTYGTANSSALGAGASRTWEAPAYAVDTNVVGTNFFCRLSNGNENLAGEATAKLGYMTGAVWNDFTPVISMTKAVPPNSNKVQRFGLSGGGEVPAGSKLAVRITNTGTLSYTVATGSASDRGDIAVTEQLFNHLPTAVAFSPQPSGSGIVDITWSAATDQDGHAIHYDVYGSDNNGASYDFVIARNLPEATTSVQWDTVAAGIALGAANNQVKVMVMAGDGYRAGDLSGEHTATESLAWTVDNTVDSIAPAAVTDLVAETRPKMGSIYLHWHAPGDDGYGKAPAAQYDIRWSTAAITTGAQYNAATTVTGEPVPDFGGTPQGYEVLGLTPGIHYYFALKTADEQGNWSLLSNSADANGGLRCGICHGTPPDDSATAGNHIRHGYTVNDCAKCHGPVENYNTVSHQDGKLVFGFGRDAAGNRLAAVEATVSGANNEIVTYWQDPDGAGPQPAVKVYEDTNGGGGFNETAWAGSDKLDSGTCFGFTSVNASGCHGPATPTWDEAATLVCADCHGDHSRVNDPYGRPYDDTGGDVQASPPNDNHGYQGLPTDPIQERRYVGQHEKHLNSSFRFAKGNSCRICHKENNHADGVTDFAYDYAGAGENALWTPYNTITNTPGTCGGTSDLSCHGVNVTPKWDSAESVECNTCHGFGGVVPDHVTDPNGVGFVDDGQGNCEWCHPAGHPREGVLTNMVLIPNNVFVGINYASGGIHLKTDIAGRGPYTTEAEMCWGCHDSNGISEWGTNTKAATGSSPYNYGTLQGGVSNWVGATWVSGTAAFGYKTGAIQSTHTTSPDGTSAVTYNSTVTPNRYEETVDAVDNIRCTNCHDVHNRDLADNDTQAGTPYLRGTWLGNPYPEDGAPQAGTAYTAYTKNITHTYAASTIGFGQVPRGGIDYQQTGGYYIDENSGFPTKGWTLESSAGLCVLCHGDDVDVLDQQTGENLWLGTNGHSNAALGGTGVSAANIFDYTHGRPVPSTNATLETEGFTNRVPNMANQRGAEVAGDQYYIYGYRLKTWNPQTHSLTNEPIDALAYDWGATVDASTVDKGYHQFSCSKCHNPHASRLPKLMITNCLDIRHNTWDDDKNSQTRSTASTTDNGKKPAYYASAQNCHRRDSSRSATFTDPLDGGWNFVTPW